MLKGAGTVTSPHWTSHCLQKYENAEIEKRPIAYCQGTEVGCGPDAGRSLLELGTLSEGQRRQGGTSLLCMAGMHAIGRDRKQGPAIHTTEYLFVRYPT